VAAPAERTHRVEADAPARGHALANVPAGRRDGGER
jgi:hypothetical protein